MPIGDSGGLAAKNIITKIFFKVLGTPDLHTHIRVRPMLKYFEDYVSNFKGSEIDIIEPGCGNGVNAFELAKIAISYGKSVNYLGIDLDGKSINKAMDTARHGSIPGRFTFQKADAMSYLEDARGAQFDIVLLVDFVEHIKDAGRILPIMMKRLKEKGVFLVSVPTPLYPKVFGKKFHDKIGHVVDGYSLNDLDRLFMNGVNGYKRKGQVYSTGFLGNIGCWFYYNLLNSENRYVNFFKSIILYPFRFLDFYNSPRVSCSLFAVYGKNPR